MFLGDAKYAVSGARCNFREIAAEWMGPVRVKTNQLEVRMA